MSKNIHFLCLSAGIGGFLKLFIEGFRLWASELCGSLSFGKSIFGGSLGLSPALLGVGYIVRNKCRYYPFPC